MLTFLVHIQDTVQILREHFIELVIGPALQVNSISLTQHTGELVEIVSLYFFQLHQHFLQLQNHKVAKCVLHITFHQLREAGLKT